MPGVLFSGSVAASARVVAVVAAAAALAATTACTSSDEGATTTTTRATTTTSIPQSAVVSIAAVKVAECFDPVPAPDQQPFAVVMRPCDDRHIYEVYAEKQFGGDEPPPAGAAYPGSLAVSNAAEAACIEDFPAFIGVAWEASTFDVQAWWPSERSWADATDRRILCAVYQVTGSATRGTARGRNE
jgi:hypothetical protein